MNWHEHINKRCLVDISGRVMEVTVLEAMSGSEYLKLKDHYSWVSQGVMWIRAGQVKYCCTLDAPNSWESSWGHQQLKALGWLPPFEDRMMLWTSKIGKSIIFIVLPGRVRIQGTLTSLSLEGAFAVGTYRGHIDICRLTPEEIP